MPSPEAVRLLRRAQAGDRDAFAELYQTYTPNVRRYVTARLHDRDRDAVPDLVQDTFCAALHELQRAHDDVPGWLLQLAARACTRHAWSQRRYLRAALTVGEQGVPQPGTAASAPCPARPTPARLAEALAELHPDERRAVQLLILDGHPRQTTARLMGCSLWALRQTRNRALRRLADRLGADAAPPPPRATPPSKPLRQKGDQA